MRKDVIASKGVVIEGLPFLVACTMETVGCLMTFAVLKWVLTEKDKQANQRPMLDRKVTLGKSSLGMADIMDADTAAPPLYPRAPRGKQGLIVM